MPEDCHFWERNLYVEKGIRQQKEALLLALSFPIVWWSAGYIVPYVFKEAVPGVLHSEYQKAGKPPFLKTCGEGRLEIYEW